MQTIYCKTAIAYKALYYLHKVCNATILIINLLFMVIKVELDA